MHEEVEDELLLVLLSMQGVIGLHVFILLPEPRLSYPVLQNKTFIPFFKVLSDISFISDKSEFIEDLEVSHVEDVAVQLGELETRCFTVTSEWCEWAQDALVVEQIFQEFFCPNQVELLVESELGKEKVLFGETPNDQSRSEKWIKNLPSEETFFGFLAFVAWEETRVIAIKISELIICSFWLSVFGGLYSLTGFCDLLNLHVLGFKNIV